MAGGLQQDDDDVISAINITPFVDIVLVLLIIFMVTSNYIAKASIEVDLPQAASAGSAVETTLNIVIAKDGRMLLNGEDTDTDKIKTFIKQTLPSSPKLQAVIAADKGVPYGEVMKIIDLVKVNGVKSFALNVDRDTRTAPPSPASPDTPPPANTNTPPAAPEPANTP